MAHDWRRSRQKMGREKELQSSKERLWVQIFFPSTGLHYFKMSSNEDRQEKMTIDMSLTRGERFRQKP
jgi:hypothetical protein